MGDSWINCSQCGQRYGSWISTCPKCGASNNSKKVWFGGGKNPQTQTHGNDHVKNATMLSLICMGYLYLASQNKNGNMAGVMATVGFGLLVVVGGAISLIASIIFPVLFVITLPIWLFTVFHVRSTAKHLVRQGLI